jgi:hypothetical protein
VGLSLLSALAVEAGAGALLGRISPAQATFLSAGFGGGISWRVFATSGPRPFELGTRVALLGTELVVSHGAESRSRWFPEAGLSLEATWFGIGPNLGVVLAVGVDASLGTTAVAVGNDNLATVPPFRASGALGIRARF